MKEYLENAKLYLKIQKEAEIYGSYNVQISVKKLKQLSEFFAVPVKLRHVNDKKIDNKCFYYLSIDGVDFVGLTDEDEANELFGLSVSQFKEGAEVWG